MTRPGTSHPATACRSRGSAAARPVRASTRHSSLSAVAAARARTVQRASGATTSQQLGTARATIPGAKL